MPHAAAAAAKVIGVVSRFLCKGGQNAAAMVNDWLRSLR